MTPSRSLLGMALAIGLLAMPAGAQELVLGKKKGEWIESLQTEKEPKRRRAAVIALGIVGAQQDDVDRALGNALANDDAIEVRQQVLLVVRNLRKEQLGKWTQRMGNVLKYDKHAPNRVQAAGVLGKLEELAKPVMSNIVAACKDPDPGVRAAIVEAIGRIGPDAIETLPELRALLKDADFAVRLNSVSTLGRLGENARDSVPDLQQRLPLETDVVLRKEIVRVLGNFGTASQPAIPALVKLLQEDASEEIRQQAVLSLGKIGEPSRVALDTLRSCLMRDTDKTVRLYLIRTMTAIAGNEASVLVKDYATQLGIEKDTDVKLAILQELAALGEKASEALPTLRATLEDPSVAVRKEARATMERITAKPPAKKEGKN